MNREVSFAPGEYYHLYNRGNNKQSLFVSRKDYSRFQQLLYLCNNTQPVVVKEVLPKKIFLFERDKTIVDIGAYCLMSNHFHLLVKEKQEHGISTFMQKLATAYSMYFNKRSERTGKLFEGVFRSRHINHDTHLKHLYAYIHLNPLGNVSEQWKEKSAIANKEGVKKYLDQFSFSSYTDYIGKERPERMILCKESFPSYFTGPDEFLSFVADWFYEKI